jgi:hypothetical protein
MALKSLKIVQMPHITGKSIHSSLNALKKLRIFEKPQITLKKPQLHQKYFSKAFQNL